MEINRGGSLFVFFSWGTEAKVWWKVFSCIMLCVSPWLLEVCPSPGVTLALAILIYQQQETLLCSWLENVRVAGVSQTGSLFEVSFEVV